MFENLTGKQIAMIILGIVVVCWFVGWFMTKNNTNSNNTQQNQPNPQPTPTPTGQETFQPNTPFTLYYFYSPNCGFCKQFAPAWTQVSNKLSQINGISVRAIDATKPENENLSFYYNVTGYPTVILVTPDKSVEYSGDRSVDDLYRFVVSNINTRDMNLS